MTKLQIFTLCAWVLYVPYHFISEYWLAMSNIRIDLLLIYLLLVSLTVAVVVQWLVKHYKLMQR